MGTNMDMDMGTEMGLVAHRLRVRYRAATRLALPAHAGPALRGALMRTLLDRFCPVQGGVGCGSVDLVARCPICPLLASEPAGAGQAGAPRPFTIEPPLRRSGTVDAGDALDWGLTLFGDAADLLPYVLTGLMRLGERGLRSVDGTRGLLALDEVLLVNPLNGRQQRIAGVGATGKPALDLPITHAGILGRARELPRDTIAMTLLTPARLVSEGRLAHSLTFDTIMRRLLRRIDELCRATTGAGLAIDFTALVDRARHVRVVSDRTRWVDVDSPSGRSGRATPIGGQVGQIVFAGALEPFLPWLAWGEVVHMGKDTAKGNGWYRLAPASR